MALDSPVQRILVTSAVTTAGFEARLSRSGLLATYATLAAALVATASADAR